ncbi:hypothetical protein [Donghicola tyrosinivorans]|uniref:Uncharacterized protein n=1 Tax=Donghicola tyrosinivorans TaxID=1652492 RepID=A0A2T0WJE2_9RHOB|nr:hypothetical protein [Donghicola tyrosinivorans]PRY86785.1 hypothetical protein CLV74_11115 [Donghicola tyrosinivorans]
MELNRRKADLLARINAAGENRYELLAELRKLTADISARGMEVSINLRTTLEEMEDEATEAEMDNMPV